MHYKEVTTWFRAASSYTTFLTSEILAVLGYGCPLVATLYVCSAVLANISGFSVLNWFQSSVFVVKINWLKCHRDNFDNRYRKGLKIFDSEILFSETFWENNSKFIKRFMLKKKMLIRMVVMILKKVDTQIPNNRQLIMLPR